MDTIHSQLRPGCLAGAAAGSNDLDSTPGARTASMLFDHGLWFEAVVRGLITELGFSTEAATSAAIAAARERASRPAPA
jgi:hypothetical protein